MKKESSDYALAKFAKNELLGRVPKRVTFDERALMYKYNNPTPEPSREIHTAPTQADRFDKQRNGDPEYRSGDEAHTSDDDDFVRLVGDLSYEPADDAIEQDS